MISNLSRLEEFFQSHGCASPQISLLQPAEPFLDTAGEDLRRRIFITSDFDGASLCLRPEFTIPVCLAHLQTGAKKGKYAYGGSVFRQRRAGPVEFLQAGMEIIGGEENADDDDIINADVEIISMALAALYHCGICNMQIVFGDQAIFEALLIALNLPQAWRSRLGRSFGDGKKIANDLKMIANKDNGAYGDGFAHLDTISKDLRKALDGNNREMVEKIIAQKMAKANLPPNGGRTAGDIAQRMLNKAQLAANQLSCEQQDILVEFLSIQVPVDEAVQKLRNFSSAIAVDIDDAIKNFAKRAELLAQMMNKDVDISWQASFGRPLDYYTGIVFEISDRDADDASLNPVCGGGRYDHLMNMLGAVGETPAIGFSLWLDRLERGGK